MFAVVPAVSAAESDPGYAIRPQFEEAGGFRGGVAAAKQGGKWGLIDKSGKWVVKPQYDNAFHYGSVTTVEVHGKWGLIDQTGKELARPKYDSAIEFDEGADTAIIEQNNQFGLIDIKGRELIPPMYDLVSNFHDGMAMIKIDGRIGFASREGSQAVQAISPRFGGVGLFGLSSFHEGLAPVSNARGIGYIDKTGEWVVEPKYRNAGYFYEGRAWVANQDERVGFIDRLGREVVDLQYVTVGNFQDGMAMVGIQNGRTRGILAGFIDKSGREVVKPQYEEVFDFSGGLAGVIRDGKLGFIDATGREIISPQYDYDDRDAYKPEFIDGLARVGKRSEHIRELEYGYIDETGKEVVSLRYLNIGLFHEGLAWVDNGSNYGYVTKSGVEIVKPRYWRVGDFSEGLAPVYIDGAWGYIANPLTERHTAIPTNSQVTIDGQKVAFEAYNIKDSNYFKLRDLAMALSGTGKPFDVSWDEGKQAIALTTGKAYTAAGGELTRSANSSKQDAKRTAAAIYLDGVEHALTAYNIADSNYFKLRDLGEALDFGVSWDASTQTISIDTSTGYTE